MKKFALLFILSCYTLIANAQGDSYNYGPYGISVSGGVNYPFSDLKQNNMGKSFAVTGYYNLTPYVPLGLEFQFGGLSGGSIVTDPHKREFNNHYKAVIIHADLGMGEIIDYDNNFFFRMIKDFHIGTGVGVISNNMAFVQRTNLNVAPTAPLGSYTFPGQDQSINFFVPLRWGFEFKVYNAYSEPFMSVNLNLIHNITWGEGMDGYHDPSSGFKNNSPDQYAQLMIGLKFNFGETKPHYKSIN